MGSRVNPVVLIGSYSETETGPWGTVTTKELVGLIRQLWPHSSQYVVKQTEIQLCNNSPLVSGIVGVQTTNYSCW